MATIRYLWTSVRYAWRELCQRRWLLAGLVLACLLSALAVGPAARALLSEGVSFSGIVLAVTAPEGDRVPDLLEQYMGNMRDIREYCTFLSMDPAEAREALARGEVTAVLELPEDFVGGVIDGSDPDIRLLLPAGRPLESLLTLWVGQSATDMLSAAQTGVYAVLDLYEEAPPAGLSREDVRWAINLRYIDWVLGRQDIFRTRQVTATQLLPVPLHYGLSLLAYLGLAVAPLFSGLYGGRRLRARRRLRCLGRGSVLGFCADLTACALVLALLSVGPMLALARPATVGAVAAVLAATAGHALLCAAFGALCCLVTADAAGGGGLAFALALVSLGAAGGILPPVMLPRTLRELNWLSPVSWLRALDAAGMGYPLEARPLAAGAVALAGMLVLAVLLYHRRTMGQEVRL